MVVSGGMPSPGSAFAAPHTGIARKPVKTATIARRSAQEAELTDSTCTPRWLADLLPRVDVDVCSNARSHVRANFHYVLTPGDAAALAAREQNARVCDGLAEPWMGTAFDNNPFSKPIPWMLKLRRELALGNCTGAIVLCKLDPGTHWWRVLSGYDPTCTLRMMPVELWHFHKRVQYDEHPDVIEARRLERVRERVEKAAKLGKLLSDAQLAKINGKSQANFNSVIVHHRGQTALHMPPLQLESVATRWVMA